MGNIYKEWQIEDNISSTLEELGYKNITNYNHPFNYDDLQEIINYQKLEEMLIKINNNLNRQYIDKAIYYIKTNISNYSDIKKANMDIINYLKNGIPICIKDINQRTFNVKLIDFQNIGNNCFEYCRQLNLHNSNLEKIIPDILIFINGLPLSIIELKAPEATQNLSDAYKQLVNYYSRFSKIGYWNIFGLVSNGFDTKYGSLTSGLNHWWSWKKTDIDANIEQDFNWKEQPEIAINNYRKNIIGLYKADVFLNIIKNYVFYSLLGDGTPYIKYIPAYQQYSATEKTIKSINNAFINKNGKGGVIWHTQGSGKSVTMVFLARRIKDYFKENFKIIYVTDRIELNEQLSKRFAEIDDKYLSTNPVFIESREDLITKLGDDNNFGLFFTTIQKFTEDTNKLSDNNKVIIIADEAHRSHNNISGDEVKINFKQQTVEEKNGYAFYIRCAFPNAVYIGFTGTPLMGNDKKTTDVFGDYIDKYTMNQAELDGSTVPIHYEKRKIPLKIDDLDYDEIDDFFNLLNEDDDGSEYIKNEKAEYIKKQFLKIKEIFNQPKLINVMIEDFWKHYEVRSKFINGKVMFVAFDREMAFNIYKEMIKQKPDFKEKIILMMTTNNKDSLDLINIVPKEEQRKEIANEFRKDNSKYKIVIVVDMWLTGFDVPDLDTLYLCKVIKFHNLMQTIARVNRTYERKNKDNSITKKEDGLVVDYIGIWKYIRVALQKYSDSGSSEREFDVDSIILKLINLTSETLKAFFGTYSSELQELWLSNDNNKKYDSLIYGRNIIDDLTGKEKDDFFTRTTKLARYYKICYQAIRKEDKKYAFLSQYLLLIKSLLRKKSVEECENIKETLEALKSKLSEIIQVGEIEVISTPFNGRRDLSYIANLMEKELKFIKENNKKPDPINVAEITENVKYKIREIRKIDSINGEKLSDKLKAILTKYEEDKDFENLVKEIQEILKTISECEEIAKEIEDQELKQFYAIIKSDDFFAQNRDSKIAKEIIYKIKKIIDENITSQWINSSQLQADIRLKIKMMLRKDYQYPPENAEQKSKLLIDELTNSIRMNKSYWIKDGD